MPELNTLHAEVPPLTGTLPPQCRQDLDSLRRFINQTTSYSSIDAPVNPSDFREVLLTGATGFLGRFLLRDLLRRNPDLTVTCIVRADHSQHAFSRIQAAFEEAEIWEDEFAPRIRAMAGDVHLPSFGLEPSQFADFYQRIDAVYHLAASLSVATPYVALRKINVFSIRSVLELCLTTRLKHVFFASTMGVFPEYFCGFANEYSGSRVTHQMQPDIASMKRAFPLGLLGYPWTKVVVEQALLHAARTGVPVALFRLPHTNVASTGFGNADDVAVRTVAAVVDSGQMPEGFTLQWSQAAVDVVADTMAAISMNPDRRFTIYHYSEDPPLGHEMQLADFGLYYKTVPYDAWKRACLARGERSPLHGFWNLIDHGAPYWFSGDATAPSHRVCSRALQADCLDPIPWPSAYTMLRRSLDWLRAHREKWPYRIPESRLDYDQLVRRAESFAREYDVPFGVAFPAWKLEGLRQLVQAVNAPEAGVRTERHDYIAFDLTRRLRNNASLEAERRRCPEIAEQDIRRPVFIVGINRTGTTLLHRLMSRDPRFWTLRGYEYVEPVPAGGNYAIPADSAEDPRRAFAEELLNASGIVDMFKGVHHFDVDEPEEDLGLLRMGFAAWGATVWFDIPDFARWLACRDMSETYAFHHRALQNYTHQRRSDGEGQWVLKAPFHLFELEALIATYPDALFIQTHREPAQFMGSWCSLVDRVRNLSCQPRQSEDLGKEQLEFMRRMLDSMVKFRTNHPELEDRWLDISFYDLVQAPMDMVAHIYNRFGWSLEEEAVAAMDAWLEAQAAQRRSEKRHKYELADFGLTRDKVDAAFSHYRDFLSSSGIRSSMLLK
ncbi:MAG: NAD-dependent epimerase/dehydratase family protein [Rhodothermaceae bacterium]|nr:NAD-dependent epimerase/dehydratase family protein [Rhodothermaceae bacterium]MXZ59130.1 NAD-dependent epimerase/dehydratase family protein [Rhodothermaceae bacterium]MYB90291.1 NAD-dependent epimerase/dehydratase family protein [Rhodothermaceae bacterium]MYD68533.1 NAD-dependent epimerase/dehydratase family protein [Rhodothermaceae bacterium]MYG45664.1 NAD-dependent epimerase/dehydratase family protein [Rhodothermaceae bacterium]